MLNSIELASCLIWLVIEWRNRLSKLKLCEQCLINLLNGNGCGTDDDDVEGAEEDESQKKFKFPDEKMQNFADKILTRIYHNYSKQTFFKFGHSR